MMNNTYNNFTSRTRELLLSKEGGGGIKLDYVFEAESNRDILNALNYGLNGSSTCSLIELIGAKDGNGNQP